MIDKDFIRENYARMNLNDLKKISNEPQKLNIEAIPLLIEEFRKREEQGIVGQLDTYYNALTDSKLQTPKELESKVSNSPIKPKKLNGWFMLLCAGLIIKPILLIRYYYNDFVPALKEINDVEKMPRNALTKLQGIETIDFESMRNNLYLISGMNLIAGILCLPLLYMILNYKRSFPKYMTRYIILMMIITLVSNMINAELITTNLVVTVVIGFVWICYLLYSKSAEKTFVK